MVCICTWTEQEVHKLMSADVVQVEYQGPGVVLYSVRGTIAMKGPQRRFVRKNHWATALQSRHPAYTTERLACESNLARKA